MQPGLLRRKKKKKKKGIGYMGNGVSCSCNLKSSADTAKYMDPEGHIRKLALPAEAAELMLESPGYVVSPAQEVLTTLRVAAMRPEEELKPGELYLMLPAARVGCRASHAELRAIIRSYKRKGRRSKKVFPFAEKKEIKIEEQKSGASFPCHGMKSYRNWTPVLETIAEGM